MREKTLTEIMRPLPTITPLPPGKRESDPDVRDLRSREKEQMHLWAERLMVELVDMWRWCEHGCCRRARQCATPNVACFKPNETELRRHVLPLILKTIAAGADEAPPAVPASPRARTRTRRKRRRAAGR